MTSLPNFSPVTAMSHVEIDQTFEKSMQQLNSSKEYYIFPENAVLINRERQILRWSYSEDILLYSNGTTLHDFENNEYNLITDQSTSPYLSTEKLTFTSANNYYYEDTVFINTETGERYNLCLVGDIIIDITSTRGTMVIPPIIKYIGGFHIKSLNCVLNISLLPTDAYEDMRVHSSFVEPSTGVIIMNHEQLEYYTSKGLITEVENVKWFQNVLKVTVY